MKRIFSPWKRQVSDSEMLQMEDYLEKVILPVTPRDKFIESLRHDLDHVEVRASEANIYQRILWIVAGFASAILLLTVGIRVIINLVRGSGHLGKYRQKVITP